MPRRAAIFDKSPISMARRRMERPKSITEKFKEALESFKRAMKGSSRNKVSPYEAK